MAPSRSAGRHHAASRLGDDERRVEIEPPDQLARAGVASRGVAKRSTCRAEVARHFRDHPLPAGERALRQTLERFDWYKGFRRGAARDLRAWLVDAGRL